jgi:deferrochelatase/peroxidase EfeB
MELQLDDIQGNVVRGYNMQHARHFMLAGSSPGTAAAFIGALVAPPDAGGGPRISTAAPWKDKPHYCLNIGFTAPGLVFLGLPPSLMQNFPDAYTQGAARRADSLGDTAAAAPAAWAYGGQDQAAEHIVLSLYTNEHRTRALEHVSTELRALMSKYAMKELAHFDAAAFPHGAVHFGYRDGIAQPNIAGAPGRQTPDMQPASTPGEFLLGRHYVNQFAGNWLGDLPPELGDNAAYGVLRMMRQEVQAFEDLLRRVANRYAVDPEWVAAKLMGRWRNGAPLSMSPGMTQPAQVPGPEKINNFDYAPSDRQPMLYDDRQGLRCPIGAHIRRLNPRSAIVMGKPHTRRLIRRAMPYGPEWTAGQQPDGIERGLVGYFVCGDIEAQFEFLYRTWVNADYSTSGLRGTREPFLGAQPPEGGRFVIRTENTLDPIVIDDLPRLTVTRGCLYCFMPGIGGLRFLARLGPAA